LASSLNWRRAVLSADGDLLVSKVILDLERGKAADIVGLSAEHLLFCHPVLSMVLSNYFQLILLSSYVPAGFKCSYMVPVRKIKDL